MAVQPGNPQRPRTMKNRQVVDSGNSIFGAEEILGFNSREYLSSERAESSKAQSDRHQ